MKLSTLVHHAQGNKNCLGFLIFSEGLSFHFILIIYTGL